MNCLIFIRWVTLIVLIRCQTRPNIQTSPEHLPNDSFLKFPTSSIDQTTHKPSEIVMNPLLTSSLRSPSNDFRIEFRFMRLKEFQLVAWGLEKLNNFLLFYWMCFFIHSHFVIKEIWILFSPSMSFVSWSVFETSVKEKNKAR